VRAALLLDPVCFLLFLPETCTNFVYASPGAGASAVDWAVHLLGKRELHVAHTLARNFWWFENVLWLDELPARAHVVVSGGDQITPAAAIAAHVRAEQRRLEAAATTAAAKEEGPRRQLGLTFLEGRRHAEFLFSARDRALVAANCRSVLDCEDE
jgi:hypothetical protein